MARLTFVLFAMVVLAASAVSAEERQKRLIVDKIAEKVLGKVSSFLNLTILISVHKIMKEHAKS